MSDKKLTDSEIVKALECCIGDTDGKDCFGCPLYEIDDCQAHLNLAALDLITRQKADIKKLTSGKCVYLSDDETTEYCVEGPCPNYKTEAQIKVEAYKEFAERLKEAPIKCALPLSGLSAKDEIEDYFNDIMLQVRDVIDNLLKELVGDE